MTLQHLNLNWFDVALVAVLIVGMFQGRKHGMSEELLPLCQWILMALVGGLYYQPVSRSLGDFTGFQPLVTHILAFLGIMLGIKLVFVMIRRAAGEKLLGGDFFGAAEYYLGMVAGTIRALCILIVGLAFLNAKLVTDAEHDRQMKAENELYGSTFFPTLGSVQRQVFRRSWAGPLIVRHAGRILIEATPYNDILEKRDSWGGRKEREIDGIVRGR